MHVGILDQATAIAASHAVMTALFVRERSGLGQEVHVSLYSVGQWLTAASLTIHSLLGIDPIIPATGPNTPLCATNIDARTANGSSAPITRRKNIGRRFVRPPNKPTCYRTPASPMTKSR